MSVTAKCLACGEAFAWFASHERIAPTALSVVNAEGKVVGVLLAADERDVIVTRVGICPACVVKLRAACGETVLASFKSALVAERAAEREGCAKLVERYRHHTATDSAVSIGRELAAQIRSRPS